MPPGRRARRRARASSCPGMTCRGRVLPSAGLDGARCRARILATKSYSEYHKRFMPVVADLIVSRLGDAGVATIFGVPGGGSNLDLVAAAGRARMPFVLTSTETAAALAAVAQAEITGRPGACLTTLGPGAASVVNGVACAFLDRAPLVVFTDSHPAGVDIVFAHQRLDQRALMASITKWSATLTGETIAATLDRALDAAMGPPPGPVHLDWPNDL